MNFSKNFGMKKTMVNPVRAGKTEMFQCRICKTTYYDERFASGCEKKCGELEKE